MPKFIEFDGQLINLNTINSIKKRDEYETMMLMSSQDKIFFIEVYVNYDDKPITKDFIADLNNELDFEQNEKLRNSVFETIKQQLDIVSLSHL